MSFLKRLIAKLFWIGLAIGVLGMTAGTMSGIFAHRMWLCELAVHFQWQYAVGLLIAAIVFGLDGRYKWAAFALLVATGGFCYHLLPLYVRDQPQVAEPKSLRLLSSNIAFFNAERSKLIALVEAEKPDVILLFEVSPPWLPDLAALDATYQNSKVVKSPRHSGIGIYSRLPLESVEIREVEGSPCVFATVKVGEQTLSVVGAHPDPPVSMDATRRRNAQLRSLAAEIARLPRPLVLAGDLNTSSWGPAFKRFSAETGLQDSRRGFGVQPTWSPPGTSFLPRTPIDHCLVSADVKVIDRRVGPHIGSDHLPVITDLYLQPLACATSDGVGSRRRQRRSLW